MPPIAAPSLVALVLAARAVAGGDETAPRFVDVLDGSGITFRHHFLDSESGSNYRVNPYDHGSGLCVADVNNDGLDDLLFLDFLGPNHLYLNRGGFKFEDVTARSGVAMERALKVGAAFGDYDGDGDLDLYVTTYRGGNHLFANRGDGTFDDVTDKSGVGYKGHSSGATWFDADGDGDLDLFVCNVGKFTTDAVSSEADYAFAGVSFNFKQIAAAPDARNLGEGCILYRNEGNGTFINATGSAGITASEWNGDVTISDYDLDGDPDLYVSNMFGANRLFQNDGKGHFAEVTAAALGRTSFGGMGCRFFDANGDGWPDLYVVDMHSDMGMIPGQSKDVRADVKFNSLIVSGPGDGHVIRGPDDTRAKTVLFGNTYFENQKDGRFVEKSLANGLETWWPWGFTVGDFDDDGDDDAFVCAGMGYPFYYWPNSLLLNDGTSRFHDVAAAAGVEPPARGTEIEGKKIKGKAATRSSRAAAVADFDNDGKLDLAVNNFNHEPYLFKNVSAANGHALRLRLRNKHHAPAFGARVKVVAGGKTFVRELKNAEGYLSQSSALLHVGLGGAAEVDSVEITWPGSTATQTLVKPPLDHVVDVDQQ